MLPISPRSYPRTFASLITLLVFTTHANGGSSEIKKGIPITVVERDGLARVNEPTQFALPFSKKDKYKKLNKLVVVDQNGDVVPSQMRVTQRWSGAPDANKKPIRWLLIDIQANVSAFGEATYYVRKKKKSDSAPDYPTLDINLAENAARADTGGALFELGGARHAFLERIAFDINQDGEYDEQLESILSEPANAGFVLTDRFGAEYSSANEDFITEIEEAGPLRTVVKVTGSHGPTVNGVGIGRDFFKYTTRYTFYAGKPYVRVTHTLRNSYLTDPLGNIGFESYSLRTSLVSGQGAYARFGTDDADPSQFSASANALHLYQDSDGGDNWAASENTSFRGFQVYDGADNVVSDGNQATGHFYVGDGAYGVTIAVRDFFPNFPKGFSYDGDRSMSLDIFPAETSGFFWLDDAQQKTTDFLLYAHSEVLSSTAVALKFFHPLHPFCDPEWVRKTKAWGDHGDLTDPPQSDETLWAYDDSRLNFVYNDAFNKASYSYGWADFGELVWAKNTHTTGSPRNRLSYFERFMINGSPSFFRMNELFVLHSRDLRTYHVDGFSKEAFPDATLWEAMPPWKWSDDKLGRDELDPELDAHRADIPTDGHGWNAFDFEHMVVDDLYEYYLLTGDPISKESLILIAEFIRTFLIYDTTKGPGSTRGIGWAMRALMKAYQITGDERFRESAYDLVTAVDETYNQNKPSPITGKVYHWITRYPPIAKHIADAEFDMPWQMGPMIHGLLLYYHTTKDKRALNISLDAADWIVDYSWNGVTVAESVSNDDHEHINPSNDNNGVNTWIPSALAACYREKKRVEYIGIATAIYNSIPNSSKDWNSWTGFANYHWFHTYKAVLEEGNK